MKFKIEQNKLSNALKMLTCAISKKNFQSILQGIKIEANNNKIKLISTDLIDTVICYLDAEVIVDGCVCVSCNRLYEIVEHLKDIIVFECEDDILNLKNGRTSFDLNILDIEDYPQISEKNDFTQSFELNSNVLFEAMKKIAYAASICETQIIGGVNFSIQSDYLTLAATDGNRLGINKIYFENANSSIKDNISFTLPVKTMSFIKNFKNENIKILFDDKTIIFKKDNLVYETRVMDGVYPKYQQLIPLNFEKIIKINRLDFINAIEKIAITVNEKTNIIEFGFNKNNLTIASANEYSKAKDIIDVENNYIDVFDICFNYKFLLECLKASNSNDIILKMNDNCSACFIQSDFDTLVMPIKK